MPRALLSVMESHAEAMRQCGAESLVVWVVVYRDNDEQCNLEFSTSEMGRLSTLGGSLAISCYGRE